MEVNNIGKEVKALILLAGTGSRLWPLTKVIHKALLPIGEYPLLWYSISNLKSFGINKICLVVGFQAKQIKNFMDVYFPNLKVKYVYNKIFNSSNSIYSYYLASSFIKNSRYIRLEGDLIYNKGILKSLILKEGGIISAVEKKLKKSFEEYSVIVDEKSNLLLKYGKNISIKNSYGEAKGIEIISKEGSLLVRSTLREIVKKGDLNKYAEVTYQNIINTGGIINYVKLNKSDFWCEIDTYEDLDYANKNIHKIS